MSIYGSTFGVGDPEWDDETPGIVLLREGGTNHYPSLELNRRGSIDGAEIPGWCVPGHQVDNCPENSSGHCCGYDHPGGWYRLSVSPTTRDGQYLLDEDAARALVKDLKRWLKKPKTHPVTEGQAHE